MTRLPRRASGSRPGVVRTYTGLAVLAIALAATASAQNTAGRGGGSAPPPAQTAAAAQKAALQTFEERLKGYLELRKTLARKLDPLTTTDDAAELAARQKALASAIQQTRHDAKPGDLIPKEVGAQIAGTVAADLKTREPQARRATLKEVPDVKLQPNQPLPADAPLTTIPPLLLARLPPLPDNLQYRFVGRHVVLLDGDVHLVLDWVERALPAQ